MPRGGKRRGAGRPKGKGPWGEVTRVVRVPESMVKSVAKFMSTRGYRLPLYAARIPAGAPSFPVEDIEDRPELSKLLLENPMETFLLRVRGDSMIGAGIDDGDLLFVDRSIEPRHKKIVAASINGQVTVKRLHKLKDKISLLPENKRYAPIEIKRTDDFTIYGVVTKALKIL